ncbi:endonuclease/exonuclease/phosphatase family protein [Rubritalea squalenifaciens]|nr:endonuclease/exonuclease/phosphatase family protein [Rubritalea squalenifaciens]
MMKLFSIFTLSLLTLLSATSATPLNLVTYNIRLDIHVDQGDRDWNQRKGTVTKFLRESGASIIGMQEVLHGQLVDLTKALPELESTGVGRDDGKTKGEYSPIFYNPKIWTIDAEDHGTFWLSGTPQIPGSTTWGNRTTRICTYARFSDKSGKSIYVFNTHWDHQNQNSREKAAELILRKISTRKHLNDPVILMGDFNANSENKAIQRLLDSPLLIDPCEQQVLTYNTWQAGLKPGLRIDHIFTSPSLKGVTVKVINNGNPPGSDHHPLQLTQSP